MGKAIKMLLPALAAAVMVLMVPVMMAAIGVRTPGIEAAHAGDAIDINDVIQGRNSDGTVDPGATLSVSLNSLDGKVSGIKEHYLNGDIDITWQKGDFGASDLSETKFDGDQISTKLGLPDAGKYVWLLITCKDPAVFWDTSYNLNSERIQVYAGEISILAGPSFGEATKTTSDPIVRTYTFNIQTPYLSYTCTGSGKSYTSYDDVYVKLTRNGDDNIIADQKISGPTVVFKNVTLPVGKQDNFKAIMHFSYGTNEIVGGTFSFTDGAEKPKKNKVYATKISSNKAVVRWTGSSGATGYEVYMEKKKVKTVKKSVYKLTVSRKGAGKAKYKVYPIVKSGSKKIRGKSSSMKAKANSWTRNISTGYKAYSYGKGQLVMKKISGSGKNYTLTCYAINNRMFPLKKYKKIKITVYADGKKIISKTIKNKSVNVKKYASKKVTLKVKGKEGDLRFGSVSYSISYDPYWGPGISQF